MENNTTLQINCIGTKNLGRCYNSSTYEVLTHYPLKDEKIKQLWEVNILGCGQEYRLLEKSARVADKNIYRAVVEIRCDSGD